VRSQVTKSNKFDNNYEICKHHLFFLLLLHLLF